MGFKFFALSLVFFGLAQSMEDNIDVEEMSDDTRMWLCRHMGPLEISTTQLMENPEEMEGPEDLVVFIFEKWDTNMDSCMDWNEFSNWWRIVMTDPSHSKPDQDLFQMIASHDEECGAQGVSKDELTMIFEGMNDMCQDLAGEIMEGI